jgi:hypothetical protein
MSCDYLEIIGAFFAGALFAFGLTGWVWALLTNQDLRKYKGGSK